MDRIVKAKKIDPCKSSNSAEACNSLIARYSPKMRNEPKMYTTYASSAVLHFNEGLLFNIDALRKTGFRVSTAAATGVAKVEDQRQRGMKRKKTDAYRKSATY